MVFIAGVFEYSIAEKLLVVIWKISFDHVIQLIHAIAEKTVEFDRIGVDIALHLLSELLKVHAVLPRLNVCHETCCCCLAYNAKVFCDSIDLVETQPAISGPALARRRTSSTEFEACACPCLAHALALASVTFPLS